MTMGKYLVQLNYNASIEVSVEADDEGEALDKARDFAEEADIRQFSLCGENDSRILQRGD